MFMFKEWRTGTAGALLVLVAVAGCGSVADRPEETGSASSSSTHATAAPASTAPTPAARTPEPERPNDGYREQRSSTLRLTSPRGYKAVVELKTHFSVEGEDARDLVLRECGENPPEDAHVVAKMLRVRVAYPESDGIEEWGGVGRMRWGLWHTKNGGDPRVQSAFNTCEDDDHLPSIGDVRAGDDEKIMTVYTITPTTPENPDARLPKEVQSEWWLIAARLVLSNDFLGTYGGTWAGEGWVSDGSADSALELPLWKPLADSEAVDGDNSDERTSVSAESVKPFLGKWAGPVDQEGSRPYSVSLTFGWVNGRLVGSSVYPELSYCKGDLVNPRIEAGVLKVDEVFVGGTSDCADTTVSIERVGDSLRLNFISGSVTGSALVRSVT